MKRFLSRASDLAPLITFVVMFLFFAIISPTFRSPENLLNVLRQNSALAIAAVGITFVLLTAEIDLSIENMAIFAGVTTAALYQYLMQNHYSPFIAQAVPIVVALVASAVFGVVSGVGCARLGVPSFMMTLAMFLITKGISLRITRGSPIFDVPPVLTFIGSKSIHVVTLWPDDAARRTVLEIPWITVTAAVFLFISFVVLRYTRFGRSVYAVGGNRVAAELSGLPVKWIVTVCLTICAVTAAFSGIILIGRMNSAQAGGLDNMLIACVSAVVLGGTSLFGGKGGIANTVVGVLTLGVLYNGLNHVHIDIYLKESICGVILLAALVLNVSMAKIKQTS